MVGVGRPSGQEKKNRKTCLLVVIDDCHDDRNFECRRRDGGRHRSRERFDRCLRGANHWNFDRQHFLLAIRVTSRYLVIVHYGLRKRHIPVSQQLFQLTINLFVDLLVS